MSDALSKRTRRDLRRAFGEQASAEVMRFVEHCEREFDAKIAGERQLREAAIAGMQRRLDTPTTVWQRLRWLVTGQMETTT